MATKMKTFYKHVHADGTETPISRQGRWWNWTDTFKHPVTGELRENQAQSSHLSSVQFQIEAKGGQFIKYRKPVEVREPSGLEILGSMLSF